MKSFTFLFFLQFLACTHSSEQALEANNGPAQAPSMESSSNASPNEVKEATSPMKAKESKHERHHHSSNHSSHHHSSHHHSSHHEFFKDAQFGDLKLKAHDSLFLSGQPSLAALKAMKAANVKLYIDIRPKSEVKPDFIKMVESQGITFVSKTVFSNDGTADLKAVDAVFALHKKNHDVGHVVGCTSGARSSAWFTLHLIRHHKMPVDEAIAVGNTAYLDASWAENIRKMYK